MSKACREAPLVFSGSHFSAGTAAGEAAGGAAGEAAGTAAGTAAGSAAGTAAGTAAGKEAAISHVDFWNAGFHYSFAFWIILYSLDR